MFLAKTPAVIRLLMPHYLWKFPDSNRKIYLTFDDGPVPGVTPRVLEILRTYAAKATFFCVGDNVRKHPDIFRQVTDDGHAVGNHTYHHLNGWKTSDKDYLSDVEMCRSVLPSRLFRPPYGRVSRSQASVLRRNYHIVMWDVLSGDYSQDISPEQCLSNITNNAGPGSIIVMHDSLKAERNLLFALPRMLEHYASAGFHFEVIDEQKLRSHSL